MLDEIVHPSDQDLLCCADGELSRRRASMVRDHLMACWTCRARMAQIERTIGDFVRAHRQGSDPQLPPMDGPRALLKLRLSLAQQSQRSDWYSPKFWLHSKGLAFLGALTLVLAFIASIVYRPALEFPSSGNSNARLLPNRSLTPGASLPVRMVDICAMDHDEVVLPVSHALQKDVFQEYGLQDVSADDYEVDYLISPGLGGTDDLRNLWPQPRYHTLWNSFVKDQLEDYLHRSVCAGKLDLATAQRDVSIDWIAAYKKYFRTKTPLRLSTSDSGELIFGPRKPL